MMCISCCLWYGADAMNLLNYKFVMPFKLQQSSNQYLNTHRYVATYTNLTILRQYVPVAAFSRTTRNTQYSQKWSLSSELNLLWYAHQLQTLLELTVTRHECALLISRLIIQKLAQIHWIRSKSTFQFRYTR